MEEDNGPMTLGDKIEGNNSTTTSEYFLQPNLGEEQDINHISLLCQILLSLIEEFNAIFHLI